MTEKPLPSISDRAAAPRRFVVLLHDLPGGGRHFDLMLDQGDVLATWQCPQPPEVATTAPMSVQRIADHRRVYLDYEGPISGNRGTVMRHDTGEFLIERWSDTEIVVNLAGRRLVGLARLTRQSEAAQSWMLALSAK